MSSIAQRIARLALGTTDSQSLRILLADLWSQLRSSPLASAGLVITAGGSTTFKTGATPIDVLVNGVLVVLGAATGSGALAGTILQNNFGGWILYVNAAGAVLTQFMNQAATLAGVTWPATPAGYVAIGYVRLNPTTGAFIGATTLLDAANTNPVYGNFVGAIDPGSSLFAA